ncbi:MAG: hypothetical protein JJT77_01545 [Crocinitomicaceae bacterium]|nr:hypothetical protein [Crocinitomicaceae bacterium]
MKITLENYEAFLLDSLESNLSPEDTADLRYFLAKHPELKIDEDLTIHRLYPSDDITHPNTKNLLFDQINEHNYHHFYIAYWEDELSKKDKNTVEHWLNEHPEYLKEFEKYSNCLLAPDMNIIYPNKELLYQNIGINKRLLYKIGTAASFIGFLVLYLLFNNSVELAPKYVQLENEIYKLKIESQVNENISENPFSIAPLDTDSIEKSDGFKKNQINGTTTMITPENFTPSFNSIIDLNESNDILNPLTALNIPMPFNEINLEYIDFSFYGAEFIASSDLAYKSNNVISGIVQRGLAAYRKPKMPENIPEIPASIKSFPKRIQQASYLAQDEVDVKVIRFRFMGINVEHTKVIED